MDAQKLGYQEVGDDDEESLPVEVVQVVCDLEWHVQVGPAAF